MWQFNTFNRSLGLCDVKKWQQSPGKPQPSCLSICLPPVSQALLLSGLSPHCLPIFLSPQPISPNDQYLQVSIAVVSWYSSRDDWWQEIYWYLWLIRLRCLVVIVVLIGTLLASLTSAPSTINAMTDAQLSFHHLIFSFSKANFASCYHQMICREIGEQVKLIVNTWHLLV